MIEIEKHKSSSFFYLPTNDMRIKRKKIEKKLLFYGAIKPARTIPNINLKNKTSLNKTKFDTE